MPIKIVNNGVRTFKIPTIPESKYVCAFENRKGGIPLPINPVRNNGQSFFVGILV